MSFAACEVPMPLLGCPNFFFSSTTYIKKMIYFLFYKFSDNINYFLIKEIYKLYLVPQNI